MDELGLLQDYVAELEVQVAESAQRHQEELAEKQDRINVLEMDIQRYEADSFALMARVQSLERQLSR